ncbi:MAG: hypothetical protein OEQ53_16285 [Saprospiraceae bacterium]|nr:hypothetical protein [Saprospiraceae bacterium]
MTKAKRENVWKYLSNMDNHAKMEPSVEKIELDGPFESGTKGRTIAKEYIQGWELKDVKKWKQFTIIGKTPENKGFLSFSWIFDDATDGTRILQRIIAEGPQIDEYLNEFGQMKKGAVRAMGTLENE